MLFQFSFSETNKQSQTHIGRPEEYTYIGWGLQIIKLLVPELFFLILAHPVYKMWIIQEPNMLELWNKMHFEEKETESIYHV